VKPTADGAAVADGLGDGVGVAEALGGTVAVGAGDAVAVGVETEVDTAVGSTRAGAFVHAVTRAQSAATAR